MLLNDKGQPEELRRRHVCPVTKPLLFLKATKNASPSSGLANSKGTIRPLPTSGKAFQGKHPVGVGGGWRLPRLLMKPPGCGGVAPGAGRL